MKIKWGILGAANIVERRTGQAIAEAGNSEFYAIASRGGERLERLIDNINPK